MEVDVENVKMTVDGQTLKIEIDLSKELGPSGSGKTTLVATTSGSTTVPGHKDIKIGVNVYKPRRTA